MDNKDTIVSLLLQIEYMVEAGYRALPERLVNTMPEGSLTFWARRVMPPDKALHTWPNGRDDLAEIYLPPEVFENPELNPTVLTQMDHVLDEISNDQFPVTVHPTEIIPEPTPPEVEETQHLGDGDAPAEPQPSQP